jgi:hypothetical protein
VGYEKKFMGILDFWSIRCRWICGSVCYS